jgi:ATP-dependent Clp protease ATP-binding subunit ClpA
LLLDEIEKAHPDIFNILLQVMDHGTLTDKQRAQSRLPQRGNYHDDQCRSRRSAEIEHGFTASKQSGDEMAEIKRLFTPEFRNRLDATISFGSLDRDVILRVVDKFLMQLEEQLHEKKVDAHFSDAVKAMLAEKGFDPLMGARPMSRLIQDTIRSHWLTNCCSENCRMADVLRSTLIKREKSNSILRKKRQ